MVGITTTARAKELALDGSRSSSSPQWILLDVDSALTWDTSEHRDAIQIDAIQIDDCEDFASNCERLATGLSTSSSHRRLDSISTCTWDSSILHDSVLRFYQNDAAKD